MCESLPGDELNVKFFGVLRGTRRALKPTSTSFAPKYAILGDFKEVTEDE